MATYFLFTVFEVQWAN